MAINTSANPYFDDYSEDKDFLRILFRPGYAVQARELTQLQTILQEQIARHGNHVFKQGAMVIPGQASVTTNTDYVKLAPTYNGVNVDTFISLFEGSTIVGTSGVEAIVLKAVIAEGTDATTLYVRYTKTGTNSTTSKFAENELIQTVDTARAVTVAATNATGYGTLASIEKGVYYINGFFCLVEPQSIIVSKYSDVPSARIGLLVTERIVTPEDDESLLDNATGSYNFAAPGAHRLQFNIVLASLSTTTVLDTNFIELILIQDGVLQKQIRATEYAVVEQTLARRTFDESGNYIVRNFELDVREHRNNNRSQWLSNTPYLIGDVVVNGSAYYVAKNSATSGTTAPVHTSGSSYDGPGTTGVKWELTVAPAFNRGVYTVEQGGDANKLAVGLEPGKAYVLGYEIEKISTNFVGIDKARTFASVDNAIVPATVGNYVLVKDVFNLPPLSSLGTVDIYDSIVTTGGTLSGNKIGTARVRGIEKHSDTAYKLFLFDVKLNAGVDFNTKVKSFYAAGSPNFTANINPVLTQLTGSVSITSGNDILTGVGTSFQTALVLGDVIAIGSTSVLAKLDGFTSQTVASLAVNSTTSLTGVAVYKVTTELLEPDYSPALFPMPYFATKTVGDTTYTTTQYFSGTASGTSLTITTPTGTFASAADTDNYVVTNNTTGAVVTPSSITVVGNQVTFAGLPTSGGAYQVFAAVNKTNALKLKTLNTTGSITFTSAVPKELLLGKADVFRVTNVLAAPGFTIGGATLPVDADYTLDIADRYDFDNGQRDTHYDIGRLLLKTSYASPVNPIKITFEYFEHSTGDYFAVNSYPSEVAYGEIPEFLGLNLRDAIDFRPRINDAGTLFTGTGSSIAYMPKRGIDFRCDFEYYLGRYSSIAINSKGEFFSVESSAALNPQLPTVPTNSMALYNLLLTPYTFGTDVGNVKIERVDNRRYTMRDIGKLEKRIENLESYTTLSLLEQQTESLDIIDANGDNRFKNGFIVDNFTGHNTGDITNPDYLCSIDMENQELRPLFDMNSVELIENAAPGARAASNYEVHGDLAMLPILENKPFIKQEYASRVENVNPFAVFTFIGNVQLTPSTDDWFEIKRNPDVINNVNGNFNTMTTIANSLSTIWNSWQTTWRGTPIDVGSRVSVSQSGNRRDITTTFQTATQVGQSRGGQKAVATPRIDMQVVSDRVLSAAIIPYIRSRHVLVQVKGLKPNTRFYPFFDGVDISQYCKKARLVEYTPGSGTFDAQASAGNLSDETARRITGANVIAGSEMPEVNHDSCLTRGDVIKGQTSNATAVVVGKSFNQTTNKHYLHVLNLIGTFNSAEILNGSISGATGTFVAIDTETAVLTSGFNGELNLLYRVPNTEATRFRCGTREFRLLSSAQFNTPFSSAGIALYRATGVLETRQQTVNAVRNAEISYETIFEDRTIIEAGARQETRTEWVDPLAQTFLVQQPGGAFLTKVDLFFASKDPTVPVTVEIREVVNGYPGKRVLPFSRVTKNSSDVNISTTNVALPDGTIVPSYNAATTFTFNSPVYVNDGVEYCLVVLSDSNNYRVWISQMGEQIPGSDRTISEQPYMGVLFKSQNASTWTADQYQDLKFTIYRAEFDTTAVANVELVNSSLAASELPKDPFQTRAGSNIVRVFHNNHGMPENSRVQLTLVTATSGTINGIPVAQFGGTKVISNVDFDSYTITVTNTATSTGYAGGTVLGTRNLQFDLFQPNVTYQSFDGTSVLAQFKSTTGKAVDGGQVPYTISTSYKPCMAYENNELYVPAMVASEINEATLLSGNKSLSFSYQLTSSNSALSPMIDLTRASVVLAQNKINNPSETTYNVATLDDTLVITASATTPVTLTGSTITSTDADTRNLFKALSIGKYVTIAGAASGNNGTFLVTNNVENGTTGTVTVSGVSFTTQTNITSGITITVRETFVDEIAPIGSSSISNYVTKRISLVNPSNYIRVKFAANVPLESNIEVYYKVSPAGNPTDFTVVPYTLMSFDTPIVYVQNGNTTFFDINLSAENLPAFDALQLKLVMKSTNTSAVPRIKDFRVIACA